jgi:hypothetical protein
MRHCLLDEDALDDAARLEHLAGLLRRRLGDGCAAIGHDVDEPFEGELLQHFADDGAADAEGGRQRILLECRPRRQAVIDDGRIEIAMDPLVGLPEALLPRFCGTPVAFCLFRTGDHEALNVST